MVLVDRGCATRITQLPQADEVVGEAGHDVPGAGLQRRDGRNCKVHGGRGCAGLAGGGTDCCGRCHHVDVEEGGGGGKVVVGGPSVNDG